MYSHFYMDMNKCFVIINEADQGFLLIYEQIVNSCTLLNILTQIQENIFLNLDHID